MQPFDKVLTVAPDFRRRKGGIASVVGSYCKELEGSFQFYPSAIFQNTYLNFLFFPLIVLGFVFTLAVNSSRYEIVHIHGSSRGSFFRKYILFLVAKGIFSKKVIYHVHGSEYHLFYGEASDFIKSGVRHMINNVDGMIVLSNQWEDYFRGNFEPKELFVLNNIVPERDRSIKEYKGVLQLLFLGRIGQRKGVFDLLNALKNNQSKYRNKLKLSIGGDGEIKKLRNFIEENQMEDMVEYVGWISGGEKNRLLLDSHIFILPSYNEGLPIGLLEAMSYSSPIISTDVGGIPNILKDLENGRMVVPGDVKGIAEAISFYLDNPSKINEHGANSYTISRQYFPSKVMEDLAEIYNEILT